MNSSLSRAALEAGVPPRYLFWFGRSGRRYLFTSTEAGSAADFAEGVAILADAGEVVWAGEVAALPAMFRFGRMPGALYVHLLAATAEERRAAIEDLRPVERMKLALAA